MAVICNKPLSHLLWSLVLLCKSLYLCNFLSSSLPPPKKKTCRRQYLLQGNWTGGEKVGKFLQMTSMSDNTSGVRAWVVYFKMLKLEASGLNSSNRIFRWCEQPSSSAFIFFLKICLQLRSECMSQFWNLPLSLCKLRITNSHQHLSALLFSGATSLLSKCSSRCRTRCGIAFLSVEDQNIGLI